MSGKKLGRFMSANIRFDDPKDIHHGWSPRRQVLAQVINKFCPDILGTQEGRRPQLEDLHSLLPGLECIHTHREWMLERMYPTLFVNPKNVQVQASGDIWLSDTPDVPSSMSFGSAFPRLCTWIKAHHRPWEVDILAVNVHLDHVLESTRLAQIKVLVEQVNRVNQDEKRPIILMGDFNEGPCQRVREWLTAAWPQLIDPWHELALPEESSHHKFRGVLPSGTRIDWILVDQQIRPHTIALDKTCLGGTWPSDHFPVKLLGEI